MIIIMTPKDSTIKEDLLIFLKHRLKSRRPIYQNVLSDVFDRDEKNNRYQQLYEKFILTEDEAEDMLDIVRDAWKQYVAVYFLPDEAKKHYKELEIIYSDTNDIDYSKYDDSVMYITGFLIR